jgi:O-antigen/teichoic acid export membrane protein
VLIATAVYALISIPLALHYLSKEEFGLWGLMASISSYLSLIDLGMSGSVARLLIDYKDDAHGGKYGALIKTGWLVLAVQGLLIFVLGWIMAPLLSTLLKIPAGLEGQFIPLMRWQGTILALSFALRLFSHLLHSHQRLDITNYIQIGTLAIMFGAQWMFFDHGSGVFSLVWAMLISTICGGIASWFATWKLHFYPKTGGWGQASWKHFVELFAYGKDLFLVAVGTQLIMASQTMIITRRLGLESAAAWYAGTRAFNLVCQALWRIMIVSAPALSEMMVRGEQGKLEERFKHILVVSASLSGVAAVAFAACNSLFVNVWTGLSGHQSIAWPARNDVLLGVWMILLSLVTCHNYLVLISKQIRFMRFVYFIEGAVYVGMAWYLSAWGLPAVIACSVICTAFFTYFYGMWRSSRYFDASLVQVGFTWLWPMWKALIAYVPIVAASWFLVLPLSPIGRLVALAVICGITGSLIMVRLGLPAELREELARRAPRFVNPLIRMMRLARTP